MKSDEVWKPGDKAWLKQRKDEWKTVHECLKLRSVFKPIDIKRIKDYFFSGDEAILTKPYDYTSAEGISPLRYLRFVVQLWLHPNTSEERWNLLWAQLTTDYPQDEEARVYTGFESSRKTFFSEAAYRGFQCFPAHGAFNGLEERLTRFFVRADRYTDETLTVEGLQVRACPWKSTQELHVDFFYNMSLFLLEDYEGEEPKKNINIFNPYQYLIDHWFSAIGHGGVNLYLDEEGDIQSKKEFFQSILETSQADESTKHPNRLNFARTMRQALDERWTPEPFKALWDEVKKEQGIAP
jgi:hypothetical protein